MLYAILAVAAILVVAFVGAYNSMVRLRQLMRNAWADVDTYLKRRAELIPNLVAAVKAYASHEQAVLTAVAEARSQAQALQGAGSDRSNAESQLGKAVINVFALTEAYPELKANQNFLQLQQELSETEKLIANARQYYNACVRDLNTKIEAFPSNIVASVAGMKHQDFFELDSPLERDAPRV